MLTKSEYYKNNDPVIQKSPEPQQKYNPILIVVLLLGYLLSGFEYREINNLKNQLKQGSVVKAAANTGSVDKVTSNDHILGDLKSRIQLIVYSDLECPFSKRFQTTTIKQVVDQYKNQVVVIYRHFPLDQIHSQTRKEAQATECAAKLAGNDGFWKITNKIYETTPSNNGFDLTTLPALALQAGIDKTAFQTCLDSGQTATIVEAQYQSGIQAGVNGTPGSFLVDSKTESVQSISGAVPFDQIKTMIDNILNN